MEAELANAARAYDHSATSESATPAADPARPIDLVHLAKQTYGERELEAELLRLFDRQAAQILARLSDAGISEGRWRADLAHTLKGSARAIGAFSVAAAAESYERAAVAGAALDPAQAELSAAVAAAHTAIGELLAG